MRITTCLWLLAFVFVALAAPPMEAAAKKSKRYGIEGEVLSYDEEKQTFRVKVIETKVPGRFASGNPVGGTPYYMAPEQSLGEAVDPRADLYALGVTFFELLTGKVPFASGDVAFHHRHTPPPDPRDRVAGIPDAFAELVLEMMAKDPEARPATAGVIRGRLQEIINALS